MTAFILLKNYGKWEGQCSSPTFLVHKSRRASNNPGLLKNLSFFFLGSSNSRMRNALSILAMASCLGIYFSSRFLLAVSVALMIASSDMYLSQDVYLHMQVSGYQFNNYACLSRIGYSISSYFSSYILPLSSCLNSWLSCALSTGIELSL